MQLDDPFPIETLPSRARDAILLEFNGRCPSIGEAASFSDAEWLQVPGVGLATLAALCQVTHGLTRKAPTKEPTLTRLTNAELLAERDRLRHESRFLRASLHRQQNQLHAIVAELLAEVDRLRSEGKSQSNALRASLHQQQNQLSAITAELRCRNLPLH